VTPACTAMAALLESGQGEASRVSRTLGGTSSRAFISNSPVTGSTKRTGTLPAVQVMPSAPWEIPLDALNTEAVRIGVRAVVARRPRNFGHLQDKKTLRLPGL
jgi:hypothetical protein